jgi:hypothetical protein
VPPLAVALSPFSSSRLTETQVNVAAINRVQWGGLTGTDHHLVTFP